MAQLITSRRRKKLRFSSTGPSIGNSPQTKKSSSVINLGEILSKIDLKSPEGMKEAILLTHKYNVFKSASTMKPDK